MDGGGAPDLHHRVAVKTSLEKSKDLIAEGRIYEEISRGKRNLLKHVIELLDQMPMFLVFELAEFDLHSFLFGNRNACYQASMLPTILKHVISGVGALHEQKFVHCDIKLENVLIVRDHKLTEFVAKITDVGATRKDGTEPAEEQDQGYMLDPLYMAPELLDPVKAYNDGGWKAGKVHMAVDMWAIGVLLMLYDVFHFFFVP